MLSLNSPYFHIRRQRGVILFLLILLLFALAQNTISYRPSVNVDDLGYASQETEQAKDAYMKAFGSPDSNLFYLEGMDFLSEQGINLLYRLEQEIWAEIPFLKKINSIIHFFPANVELPLKLGTEEAALNQQWLKQRVLQSPAAVNRLISADGRKVLVVMNFVPLPGQTEYVENSSREENDQPVAVENIATESPYISIGREMDTILQRYRQSRWADSGLKIWSSGAAYIVYQQFSFYVSDLSKIFLLLLLVMLCLIFVMLRSWLAFVATVFNAFVTNWLTVGVMSWLNLQVDLTFLMIPITIGVATAIGYSVHFYNHFRHSLSHTNVETALAIAWLRCVRPITFTALTTMFSFLSLRLVPIRAIQVTGYACLLEVFIIYIFTMTIFPLILSFTRYSLQTETKKRRQLIKFSKRILPLQASSNGQLGRQLEWLSRYVFRYRKIITIISALLFLVALYYTMKLRANYKFSEFMGRENQIVRELEYLAESDLAPVGTISIVVYSANGLFSPEGDSSSIFMLKRLDDILQQMSEETVIRKISWLGNLIEDAVLLRKQNGGITAIRSMAELNGLLLLSRRLSGFDAADWLSQDRKSLRILLEVNNFESKFLIDLMQKYRPLIEMAVAGKGDFDNTAANSSNNNSDYSSEAHVFFTGFMMDTSRGDTLMTRSFIQSILVSIVIVFFFLLLIFRRLYVTLISLIPNVFPIVLTAGFISFWGIPLNSFNFLMFPMVIGLIVDDTIHFFYTVICRLDSSRNYRVSIRMTLLQVGPALVQTTVILCSAFAVFWFSKFQGLAYMGFFTVLVIFLALFADLVLGPIFLALLPVEKLQHKTLGHRRAV